MYFSALQLVSVCRNRTESTDSDLNAQTYNINPSSTVAYTHDCYAGFQCAKLKFKHTINNIVFHISVGIVKMGVCLTDRHLHLYHSGCFLFFFFFLVICPSLSLHCFSSSKHLNRWLQVVVQPPAFR